MGGGGKLMHLKYYIVALKNGQKLDNLFKISITCFKKHTASIKEGNAIGIFL